VVPCDFLAALLHDSTCPWEPFAKDECRHPLHGQSFTPMRDALLEAVGESAEPESDPDDPWQGIPTKDRFQ